MRDSRLPRWLRRGLEAGLLTAALAVGTVLAMQISAGASPFSLRTGPIASVLLAAPVLALGIITIAYPVALAATRSDSLLGAGIAFFLAAGAVAFIANNRLLLDNGAREVPIGAFVAALGAVPAVLGLAAGQLLTPLGFGRRAAVMTMTVAGIASLFVLGLVATVV